MTDIGRAVHASSVGELAWTDPDGAPDGFGVVTLWWQEAPAVAFTYALEAPARAAAASPLVALTLTEARSTSTAFTPVAIVGRPRLVEDVDGRLFTEELLDQELRRYPPARKFADSPMLRREHWWYLPRLVLVIDVQTVHPLPARASAREHVLVVAAGDRPTAHVVRPDDSPQAEAHGAAGRTLSLLPPGEPPLPVGRAALLGQEASFPDLERWSSWCFRGRCDGTRLHLTQPAPTIGLPPPPSIWQRLRSQHAFGRACRTGINRAERRR